MKIRKENRNKLDKIFFYFEDNIFNPEEYNEYSSRTTNLMVAFGDWIEHKDCLGDAVYKVFGSDDERLLNKVHDIFERQVTECLEGIMKPFWEVT